MKKCPHCEEKFEFERPKQFGAHIVNCSFNPKRKDILNNLSISLKGKKKKTKLCDKCNKEISTSNFDRHYVKCDQTKRQAIKIEESWKTGNVYKCPHCDKNFTKTGIGTHIFMQHTIEGTEYKNKKFSDKTIKQKMGWSRGLTKDTDERVKNAAEQQHNMFITGEIINHWQDKKLSAEHKSKLSIAQSNVLENCGIANRFKFIKYYTCKNILGEEFLVRGTYEVKMSDWLNDKKILWVRKKNISYKQDDVLRTYTPDFFLPEHNLYLETKGYYPECDQIKMKLILEQNDINLRMIFGETIKNLDKIKNINELF